jgi:hypothetical protein
VKATLRLDWKHWLIGINWDLGESFPMSGIPFVAIHFGPLIIIFGEI